MGRVGKTGKLSLYFRGKNYHFRKKKGEGQKNPGLLFFCPPGSGSRENIDKIMKKILPNFSGLFVINVDPLIGEVDV